MVVFNSFQDKTLFSTSRLNVMSLIWNAEPIIRYVISVIYDTEKNCDCVLNILTEKARDIVEDLDLPENCETFLKSSVHPMALSLCDFFYAFIPTFVLFSSSDLRIRFFWTDRCVLDEAKIAEFIIQQNSGYPRLCLEFASLFCIDYLVKFEVPDPLMPDEVHRYREHIYHPNNDCEVSCQEDDDLWCEFCWKGFCASRYKINSILIFWAKVPTEKRASVDGLSEQISSLSLQELRDVVYDSPRPSVIKYFIGKTADAKAHDVVPDLLAFIIQIQCKSNLMSVIPYLASRLSSDEALNIFRENAYDLLDKLLHWSYLDYFQPAANELYSSLTYGQYLSLVYKFIELIKESDEYRKVLDKFLAQSPNTFRDFLRKHIPHLIR